MPKSIPLAYFLRIPNVGDRVNPLVVAEVGAAEVHYASNLAAPHLLAIGSIAGLANSSSLIWGSGVLHPGFGVGSPQPQNVRALRGKLSFQAIRDAGIAIGNVPLGDPAFLAPKLLGIKRSPAPRWDLGIVMHYVDRTNPIFLRMLQQPNVVDLNVHSEPDAFLSTMAECEAVVSTSLHGLVFAEAMGIPNLWVKASDRVLGDGFKFCDWFSTTSRPQQMARPLDLRDTADSLISMAALHDSDIDVESLRASFPHEIQEISGPRMSLEKARAHPLPIFFISYNRGAFLEEAISAAQRQRRKVEIVVHDNGSTDPFTVAVLKALESEGVKVVRAVATFEPDEEVNRINETIQAYFSNWSEPQPYIVSDCDVDLSAASVDSFDIYSELLNAVPDAQCAGAMLDIGDIPAGHELYLETRFGRIACERAVIDSGLSMHRAGEPFRRPAKGIRGRSG